MTETDRFAVRLTVAAAIVLVLAALLCYPPVWNNLQQF